MAPLFVLIELCFSVGLFHELESTVSKAADKKRADMDKAKGKAATGKAKSKATSRSRSPAKKA